MAVARKIRQAASEIHLWRMQISEKPLYTRAKREPRPPPLGQTGLHASLALQQVVPQEWNEGHGNDAAGHQGCRDHDRQRVNEFAHHPADHQEGKERDTVGDRGVEDGTRQFLRSKPGGNIPFFTQRQFPVDRIPGHDRVVHQEAQGDDQRGDGNLLQVDADEGAETQRHGQGDGDGQSDDEGAAPFHENQRHRHHDDDGLEEAIIELADFQSHPLRFVAGTLETQVSWQHPLEGGDRRVHIPGKIGDLRALHMADGQGDGARGPEFRGPSTACSCLGDHRFGQPGQTVGQASGGVASGGLDRAEIQRAGRILVAPDNFHMVPQVDGIPVPLVNYHVPDFIEAGELAGGLHIHALGGEFKGTPRGIDISLGQQPTQ